MITCYSLERLSRECLCMYYATLKEQTCNWKQWLSLRRVSGLLFFHSQSICPFECCTRKEKKKERKKPKEYKMWFQTTRANCRSGGGDGGGDKYFFLPLLTLSQFFQVILMNLDLIRLFFPKIVQHLIFWRPQQGFEEYLFLLYPLFKTSFRSLNSH